MIIMRYMIYMKRLQAKVKRGLKVSEILDKTIDATVDKYIYRGYEGTTLIDFR